MTDTQLFTSEILDEAETSVLCWLATTDADGWPSVSPKQIWAPSGPDRVVIAEIASPNSVRNIRADPRVCVSFVDVFRQRGHKLYGRAQLVGPDSTEFRRIGAVVLAMAGDDYPVRQLIVVDVERTARIRAPSYTIFPHRTEAERQAIAHDTYGVVPKP
ncbi:pyridoxamine 5'-phosphate oxidase family protein [Tropicimonas sp. S265A]|uniref:pyridoxamine 5'-phosphate oxidase family protein n=1 Tax=Tropicimonas sp. S265A TaxID=3415134 RepID=UPI003C7CF3CF